jgi:hypothetical protein
MGWVVLLGILQTIWMPEEVESESQASDWIYMLGDDLNLAAGLMMWQENRPSVCIGSMGSHMALEDYTARGSQAIRLAEGQYPLEWDNMPEWAM